MTRALRLICRFVGHDWEYGWQGNGNRDRRECTIQAYRHRRGLLWAEALQDPNFVRSLDEGLADVAAGRVSPWPLSALVTAVQEARP